MEFAKNNLTCLRQYHPHLADGLETLSLDNPYEVSPSRQGPPTLRLQLEAGDPSISLHSSYDPIQEAARFIEKCEVEKNQYFIVLGAGLGYHLRELVARAGKFSRIIVIEKDPQIFRLAMQYVDWRPLLENEKISLLINTPVSKLAETVAGESLDFLSIGYKTIVIPPLTSPSAEYYEEVISSLNTLFQETQVELGTQSALFTKVLQQYHRQLAKHFDHAGDPRH